MNNEDEASPSRRPIPNINPQGINAHILENPEDGLKQPLVAVSQADSPDEDGGIDGELAGDTDDDDEGSDSSSLLDEYLSLNGQAGSNSGIQDGNNICTPEESAQLRRQLREIGPVAFIEQNLESDAYTAKKLLTAFGVAAPPFLEGLPDKHFYSLLFKVISREITRRLKLPQYNSLQDAIDLINKSSNIIVLTGAGISTSLGIPDFRSKGTGLYSKLEHLGLDDPQDVFEINLFREDPSIFFSVAKDIIPDLNTYTPTHKFIAMLHEHGKLLTNYSQNIDNLEINAGVPKNKLIQCHGSFGTATCIKCHRQTRGEDIFPEIKAGQIPRCKRCANSLRPTAALKRKRSTDSARRRKRSPWADGGDTDEDDDAEDAEVNQPGVMKPDITFFGEELPSAFSDRLTGHDRDLVDLCIVIGTSLKVSPVSEIVNYIPAEVPAIYISREAVRHMEFDIDLLGECDVVIGELCKRLGWEMKHEMLTKDKVNVNGVGEGGDGEGKIWLFGVEGKKVEETTKTPV